jgi:hypothetical protein
MRKALMRRRNFKGKQPMQVLLSVMEVGIPPLRPTLIVAREKFRVTIIVLILVGGNC